MRNYTYFKNQKQRRQTGDFRFSAVEKERERAGQHQLQFNGSIQQLKTLQADQMYDNRVVKTPHSLKCCKFLESRLVKPIPRLSQ